MKLKATVVLPLGIALATASGAASGDVLFQPIGFGPEVFSFNGATMSGPLASNPYALNSPKVYLIFVGPNFKKNGANTPAVNSMVASAKAILSSSYLSGIKQYGSNGTATFGNFTVDTSLNPLTWTHDYMLSNGTIDHTHNPMWFETDRILANPTFSSWKPPPGSAVTAPIYFVVRYANNGTGVGGAYGGSNSWGPNDYTKNSVNGVDVAISSADQVDQFSWVFSHELVERMSAGVSRDGVPGHQNAPVGLGGSAGQIADGEPEGSQLYAWRLPGGSQVTSYWSVMDQAFLVPDGNLHRALLEPVWNGGTWKGTCVSLQQGNLFNFVPPNPSAAIDTQVAGYAVDTAGSIFDFTVSGQVKAFNGGAWTALTGTNTKAYQLVAPRGGGLFALASNDSLPGQVWKFSGTPGNWTPLTDTNARVDSIATAGGTMFMLAQNGAVEQVSKLQGTTWIPVTGTNTKGHQLLSANDTLYMLADNGGGDRAWQFAPGSGWTPITDTNTAISADGLQVAGDVLYMNADIGHTGVHRVWQYGLSPNVWTALTGTNTSVQANPVVQDGMDMFLNASNGGHNRAWQFGGYSSSWTPLTGTNTQVNLLYIDFLTDTLRANATNDGDVAHTWQYSGTPNNWILLQ
jgi:hypothetical protein